MGVRGERQNASWYSAPHPRPLAPQYRGEGSAASVSAQSTARDHGNDSQHKSTPDIPSNPCPPKAVGLLSGIPILATSSAIPQAQQRKILCTTPYTWRRELVARPF